MYYSLYEKNPIDLEMSVHEANIYLTDPMLAHCWTLWKIQRWTQLRSSSQVSENIQIGHVVHVSFEDNDSYQQATPSDMSIEETKYWPSDSPALIPPAYSV